jgi:hypothetical protein
VWGSPLSAEDEALYLKLSGGRAVPAEGHDRVLVVKGRRGGGSETIARWATYEAIHGGHELALAPGQVGVAAVITPEHKHAREVLGYARGLAALPQVRRHVARVTDDAVTFANGIEVRITTANEMAVAATFVFVLFDEAARLPGQESATPDKAIVAAVLPGMAPIRGAPRRRLVAVTSAFVDTGWAFEVDRDNFGRADADTLVLRGSTERFNPNVDVEWLERERRRDPMVAAREFGDGDVPPVWMASVLESWFGAGVIEKCVDKGRGSLEPAPGWTYTLGVDAAFSRDNFGIAIVSRRGGQTIVVHTDALRPPLGGALSPRACVNHVVQLMRTYGIDSVLLDQFCAPVLIESFEERGVDAVKVDWTGSGVRSKAARYREVREEMRDGRVRLVDDRALLRELHRVRGRTSQQGHESIDAPGKGVDDRVSALVLAASEAHEDGGLPGWARPEFARGVADLNLVPFDPDCLGRKGTAEFMGPATTSGADLERFDCANGEVSLHGRVGVWPPMHYGRWLPGGPTRYSFQAQGNRDFINAVERWRERHPDGGT